ncbi:TIGR03757 family integrating conjugative element protein [Pseudomonas aeruginosa]|uniref:TIGR03757 family integrating conjugative element protein n=1 Tax=Pseudomonas aeruginosa TaxID=287 RepID=UPI0006892CB6|nr:TIGR03757 family integrating conjugative element protein [Pseudomonas aeruginosa]WCV81021.1 TIGR03757 family integrating conjugative element protein [Pseudomonas aeruginosa]HBO0859742.1 TIGR03757 family integrating conjugative element protein [Pseudomonas aeruginosa]HCE6879294.1 TIGR03757 family integrating conjugative element protein [Pseudomonas aeruginosa]HDR2971100.1 TIGR03757 family integrating conjugative element protein [Pseudomonas aeruginosa]
MSTPAIACTPWRHALAVTLFAALLTQLAHAAEVLVVTDSKHPVTGARKPDRVIELDAAQRIEAQLSQQLPDDPQRAVTVIQQRLQQGGPALRQQMRQAYQGLADAWSLGITTLPAVVLDRRYVVYGEPDVAQAIARIEAYRGTQP